MTSFSIENNPIVLGTPLDLRLDRTRQAKRIGALVLHVLILRIASAGVSTNPAGTPPRQQVVDRHSVFAGEPALPAAESQSSDAGGRDGLRKALRIQSEQAAERR